MSKAVEESSFALAGPEYPRLNHAFATSKHQIYLSDEMMNVYNWHHFSLKVQSH